VANSNETALARPASDAALTRRAQVYARRKEIADLYGGFSSGALSHGQFLAGMKALGLPLGPSFYFATRSGRADFSLHTLFKVGVASARVSRAV
jgi:hypothetical protein